jgi:ribosomal protein S18 acetylase RimI-like enzyme
MTNALTIRNAGKEDLAIVRRLAEEIWPDTYAEILSADQLRYMMELIYSLPSLQEQLIEQHHTFLIASMHGEPVGFASYSLIEPRGIYKLHKIYIHPKTQGKGAGKALIDHIVQQLQAKGAASIRLNVNRHNKAKLFYERLGFAALYEEDIDIGNNYFMNDYVMELKITHSPSP